MKEVNTGADAPKLRPLRGLRRLPSENSGLSVRKRRNAHSAREFGGYRANIVTYTIARLAHETGQRIDLDGIWRAQRVGPALMAAIDELCVPVHHVITHPVRVANVTEWAKRPEC